ncbi:hypothetical protein ANCCAN_21874 [Ancylostoma caninum]|uniref:Uncharacterized protein n=1 Tax=Ancylostoma caninum TaxID=29170 RepID=A0A368FJK0_ANCCA|nr:hypothetical protein ANCCAN_21874 [Ancylostoma caninum]
MRGLTFDNEEDLENWLTKIFGSRRRDFCIDDYNQYSLFLRVNLDTDIDRTEADAMTKDAQNALRRVIEKYTANVRFCIICNYLSSIIPAIQSRLVRHFLAII